MDFDLSTELKPADDEHRFWMVWVSGKGAPTVQHKTLAGATQAAINLSRKERLTAHVMEVVGSVVLKNKSLRKKPKNLVFAE